MPFLLWGPARLAPLAPLDHRPPQGSPLATAYVVFPICCVFLSPLLLSEPAVGLLRLGKQQGLRNEINR